MNEKATEQFQVIHKGSSETSVKILFIICLFAIWGIVLFHCVVIHWYHAQNPIRQYAVFWKLMWMYRGFSIGAIAAALTAFLLRQTKRKRIKEPVCLLIGVAALLYSLPTPYFPFSLSSVMLYPALNVRSLISRVSADQRSLALAIEEYYQEHNAYSDHVVNGPHSAFHMARQWSDNFDRIPTFRQKDIDLLYTLTTPVGYITSVPSDPFAPFRGTPYGYYHDEHGWILTSPGPDRMYDMDFKTLSTLYNSTISQPSPELLLWSYDPSNGVISMGDIFRVKQ